jgi:hypothetical protein
MLRLTAKEKRALGRYRKIYEKVPTAPYLRLLEPPDVSDGRKAEPRQRQSGLNPVALKRKMDEARERLLIRARRQDITPKTARAVRLGFCMLGRTFFGSILFWRNTISGIIASNSDFKKTQQFRWGKVAANFRRQLVAAPSLQTCSALPGSLRSKLRKELLRA